MRYIKLAFWALVAICLVVVALANAQPVELRAMPQWLADLVGRSPDVTLPLYLVIFAGVAAGLLIGFVWEWLREHKHRVSMRAREREVNHLEREVKKMRAEKHEGQDDVLALLDAPASK
ncbi:MAG: DUF1049 domain-containing protein [Rhodobacterales bacterium]|nr:MAG: DUF1049 domain-containing protein [Rhodobacterales bacterium]